MKNLIDRYLYDVVKRLPERIRDDVSRELRSNIEDMLPDDPAEEDIRNVLISLGSPAKLAAKYHPNPRYLVSPERFGDYITILKIVAITLAAILAALAVFKVVFGDPAGLNVIETIAALVAGLISGAFTGIVYAFFWVTLIFFLVERFGNKAETKPWSPDHLPDIPSDSSALIRRSDAVAEAFFSILFMTIFLVGTLGNPPFIAWYESGQPTLPLFNAEVVQHFLPFYIFLMALTLVAMVIKAVAGRWTPAAGITHIIYSISSAAVGIGFLSQPDFLNEAFMAKFADKLSLALSSLQGYAKTAFTVIIVLIVIGTIAEVVKAVVKTTKGFKS